MSGVDAQRGFIYQTLIAMIECLERDDWDQVKLEPDTQNHMDKIDIQFYQRGKVIRAIQVKSSKNKFCQPSVERWLENAKADAPNVNEITLYLVGDLYTSECDEYIRSTSEIKTYPFDSLDIQCRRKMRGFVEREGRGDQVDEDDLIVAYNNLFAQIHNNSISPEPFEREDFERWLSRVLSFPKCLTGIPAINRNVGLVGRDEELCEIREMLDGNGCIALISGLGGIGKTAVMRWICNEIKEDGNANNHVAWITCGASLQEDLLLLKEALGFAEGKSVSEDYKRILNKLRNFKGTLYLFLDNMCRIPDAQEMETLNSLQPNVHIMICARHKIEDIPCKELGSLDPDASLTMFYKYYEKDQGRIHETSALEIINKVNRHTLLVELLAKAAGKSGGSLKDFNEELKLKGFFDVFTRPIKTKHDEYLTIEESIIRLYEISKLTEKQKYIMSLFSIFTPEKEIFWKVADWAGFDMEAVDELIDRAWIERGGIENGFFIHQIIRDSLTKQVGTSLKIEEYGNLLNQVVGTKEYIPQYLDYTMVRERLVLTDDVAKYLEARIAGIIKNKNSLEDNKELIVKAGALFANLSGAYYEQGDYKQAQVNLEKALEIHMALFGTEHPITAKTYNNLALLCGEQKNYEQALVNFKKAQEILERVLGTEHPDTARVYNAIAEVFHAQGNNEQAQLYYIKALKVREELLGTEHPDTVVTYIGLADVYTGQGNNEQALLYLTKALEIREKYLGTEHPDTAEVYNNLVSVYLAKRDYEQALYYGKKAMEICDKCLGTKHFVTAVACNTLAEIYLLQGNLEQTLHYCKKAIEICERIRGPKHLDTALIYDNLAAIYQLQGDLEQALYYRKRALEIYERELGPEHPDTVMAYRFLAILYQEQGDFEQAQIYYEKCSENCALHPFISQT